MLTSQFSIGTILADGSRVERNVKVKDAHRAIGVQ